LNIQGGLDFLIVSRIPGAGEALEVHEISIPLLLAAAPDAVSVGRRLLGQPDIVT